MKQTHKFLQLTMNLLSYFSYSENEQIMKNFMIKEMQSLGFVVKTDSIGNIYGVRGRAKQYPLLNAHMDIVFDIDDSYMPIQQSLTANNKKSCENCENFYDCVDLLCDKNAQTWNEARYSLISNATYAETCTAYIYDKVWSEYNYDNTPVDNYSYTSYMPYTYNYTKQELTDIEKELNNDFKITYNDKTYKITSNGLRILGGDDKCGVAIALQTARELPNEPMKLLFTVQEETGCIGVSEFCKNNAKWLEDVKYSLTIDRRHGDELITHSCGKNNCSKNFASQLLKQALYANIMVKCEHGTIADVIQLRKYVKETCNMSAGYYNPHTLDEYVQFDEMLKIKEWVKNIVKNVMRDKPI